VHEARGIGERSQVQISGALENSRQHVDVELLIVDDENARRALFAAG